MNIFRRSDIEEIAKFRQPNCISILMNPHKVPTDRKKDRLIFKNFVDQAEHYLKQKDMRPNDRQSLLAPAKKLLADPMFWTYQATGLAVYLTSDWHRIYRLPIAVGESARIEHTFNVKPLLKYFDSISRFNLLTLDQQGCKLYEGSIDGLVEQHVDGFEEALSEQELINAEKQLQFHNARVGATLYHGHSDGEHKTRIHEYFQRVDRALHTVLRDSHAPLILGGVDYLHAIYFEVNSNNRLHSQGIIGNTSKLDHDELHAKALNAIEPVFREEREAMRERFHEAERAGRTSSDVLECLNAAGDERIDSLLICETSDPRRYFQDTNSQIVTSKSEDDVVGKIALQTLSAGGKLFFVKDEQNENRELRAIFRSQ